MRVILLVIAVLFGIGALAGALVGATAHATQPATKGDGHVGRQQVHDGRQGGETIDDAVLITDVPFYDDGATCDNIDDYDEICPYSGSTSPDVVYKFIPQFDEEITIDLCGSSYDTKLYVYDADLNLIACNDDYYFDDTCGIYVSLLEFVHLDAGQTYYIVVDGYGGDCGAYEFAVYGPWHFPVHCPDVHIDEGEPDPYDGYVDVYNGTCDQALHFASDFVDDCAAMCARGGSYYTDGVFSWDHDWYVCQPIQGTITVSLDTEAPQYYEFYTGPDCDNLELVWTQEVYPWEDLTFEVDVDWAPLVYVHADSPDAYGYGSPFDYVLEICGITPGPVGSEARSWSALKQAYR